MAFSIRSIFGKPTSRHGDRDDNTATLDEEPPTMNPPGEPPFAPSLLFKTVNAAETLGHPVSGAFQSPFTSAAAPSSGSLTVGDMLPLLPVDVARASQIPSNQPLHLPEDVMQQALRSGQPAVPLFEIYRVCPAMFQTPISPQDPRQVPLPSHKIGHAPGQAVAAMPIREALNPAPAQSAAAPAPAGVASPSPFGGGSLDATSPFASSPFAMVSQALAASSPFSSGPAQSAAPAGPFATPAAPAPSAAGESPFASPFAGPLPGASPFSSPPSQPQEATSAPAPAAPAYANVPAEGGAGLFNPFSAASTATASVGGATDAARSPFGLPNGAQKHEAPPSPFSGLTGGPSPFTHPAPASAPEPAANGSSPFSTTSTNAVPTPPFSPFGSSTAPSSGASPFAASPPHDSASAHPQAQAFAPLGASPFSSPLPPALDHSANLPVAPVAPPHGQVFPGAAGLPPMEPNAAAFGASPFAMPSPPAQPIAASPPAERTSDSTTKLMASPLERLNAVVSEPVKATPAPQPSPASFSTGSPFATGEHATPAFPSAPSAYPQPAPEAAPTPSSSMPLPFLKILSIAKSQSPASTSLEAAAPAPYPFSHPTEHEVPASSPLPPAASLFQPLPEPEPVTPPPTQQVAAAPVDQNHIQMSLVAALKNSSAEELGINPELIPAWIKVTLPIAAIENQLASGRVRVPVSLITEGLEAGYRNALANARPGLEVLLPTTEVFHALPAGAALPPPQPPVPVSEPAPFATASAPVTAEVPEIVHLTEPTFAEPAVQPEPVPPMQTLAQALGPVATPPAVVAMPKSSPRDAHRDILLRALLQASGGLDADKIVSLTARQQGVTGVVCLLDGREVCSAGNGTADAEKFCHQASRLLSHVHSIIALTGFDGTETFSMRSDGHIVTFSFQGATTLCVLHDPAESDRGLPEKITLISRELAGMLADSPPFA